MPSTMAIWAKMPTTSNHTNGTYTFTNAGATGREGPTQAQVNASYSGTNLAGSVTINTQGIQEWTVPASGTYRIEAWGAKGGNGTDPYAGGIGQNSPGKGAYLAGNFALTSGELIKILVGQVGESASGDGGGGGGGGTFVIKGSTTPLVVAGGGGGGGGRSNQHGVNASLSTSGTSSANNTGSPGQSGQGGSGGGESWGSGGGGGFLGDGGNGGNPATGGHSFSNGGTGGQKKSTYPAVGGFGGGGGVAYSGGGGGGYSGGAGGPSGEPYAAGGGGGSYNSGSDQTNTAGTNDGHGRVVITALTPLPFELNSTTALTIAENQSIGTVVGEIVATASDANFTFDLSAHTSQDQSADTPGAIAISFFVNGAWTSTESFFTGADKGEIKTKTFTTAAKPTMLKFLPVSNNNGWGYWKVVLAGKTILEDQNGSAGSPIGTVPYWVDGDGTGGAPTFQDIALPSSFVFSLVDGNGSTDNHLFSIESNGTLKTAAVLDFETNSSHSIRVRGTDELNASVEKVFDVNVTDVNFSGASYVFTNAGAIGRLGPTQSQIDANYSGTNLANKVTINTRGIQEWVVPADGNYSIEAWGAQGGRGGTDSPAVEGGQGAKIKGLFSLSANTSIKILIGQMGLGGGDNVGGGGGGASFVISGSNTPILVAGAGGGGSYHATFEPGASSRIGGNGRVELSSLTSAGATHNASGGAGFNSSSVPGSQAGIASSFTSGGTGATGKNNHDGGFGGGGGGSSSFPSGGGGGGYRGGNASALSWSQSSGQSKGGYSYNSGSSKEDSTTLGYNSGHGRVIITQLSGDSPPPVNQAPGNLQSVSSLSIEENQPTGSVVGQFNATDADNGDTLTYTLVDGNGSSGNTLFTLDTNGSLKTAAILDFEANASLSVRVRVSDNHNATVEKVFDINVTDDPNDNTLPQGTTFVFSNAGATGRLGPTQAQVNAGYSGTNLANSVTINTQGIQMDRPGVGSI